MDALNIYTLLMIIRSFSNEITVRGLSADLGISYSTLARCKNGVWPRSITRSAMHNVFEDCRERFFGGSGEALAHSVLLRLQCQGIDTRALELTLANAGYEAFLTKLMTDAAASPTEEVDGSSKRSDAHPASIQARSDTSTDKRGLVRDVAWPLLAALISLMGLFRMSLASAFAWATSHQVAFFGMSLLIALAPLIVGMTVDTPLAWHTYHKRHPDVPLTPTTLARVAKYGDPEVVIDGAGRFNLAARHIIYQASCNVSGMLCYLTLMAFLVSLPGFVPFFMEHEWIEFLKVCIIVALLVAHEHTRVESRRMRLTRQTDDVLIENPDAYLPTRLHVWANAFHLVWTISLLIVLLLSMVAYGLMRFRSLSASSLILLPYLQGMIFFAYSSISPAAVRTQATGVGVFLPGVIATSLGFLIYSLGCFLPSQHTPVIVAVCTLCPLAAIAWYHRHAHGHDNRWLADNQSSGTFVALTTGCLVCLLVIGLATSSFA